jgi:hypothetical protein
MRKLMALLLCALAYSCDVGTIALGPALAGAQVIKGGGTAESDTRISAGLTGTLTFPDALGTRSDNFELIITGAPATLAVTLNGCMGGGTCTALTTYSGTSNTVLSTSGGPYTTYQIVYTMTGGTSPVITVNRLATAAGIPSTLNPGFIGRSTVGFSPVCVVDGVTHKTIGNPDDPTNCVDALNALGVTGTGEIYSSIPEDLIPAGKQPFARTGVAFAGAVYLSNSLGPTATPTCTTSAPLTCWLISYPVDIPSGLTLSGLDPAQASGSVNGGTTIAASPTFMQRLGLTSLGTPGVPACVASGGDGTIPAAGTLFLRVSLLTNASDPPGANGTGPKTQLRGPVSAQSSVVLCGANDSVTWTIASTPVRGSGTQAQEMTVYASTDANNLVEVTVAGCSTSAGVIDVVGGTCRLPIGGGNLTFTITSLLQNGSNTPPAAPLVDTAKSFDMSNPMFILGTGPDTRNSSASVIKNLTLACNPTLTDVVGTNTPAGAIQGLTGNEQSGVENVSFYGGCAQYYVYMWQNSNNSHLSGLNAGSSVGPTSTDFSGVVLDARMPTGGTSRQFLDSTIAAHDGSNGQSVNMVLVTGRKAWTVIHGLHTENAGGGCGIKFTNAANGNIITSGHTSGVDTIGGAVDGNALVCIDGAGVTNGVAAGRVVVQSQSDTNATGKTLLEDANIPSGFGNNNGNNVWVYNSLVVNDSYQYDTQHTFQVINATTMTWNPVTFANLGTPANGTVRYCSDCTLTCAAGASNGQICERINGAWTH